MKKFILWLNKAQQHIFFWLFVICITMSFISIGNFEKWLEWSIDALMMYFFYMDAKRSNTPFTQHITINNKSMETHEVIDSICKGLEQSFKSKEL